MEDLKLELFDEIAKAREGVEIFLSVERLI